MARDIRATDKRRIQDDQGDGLSIGKSGQLFAGTDEHLRTSMDKEYILVHLFEAISAGSSAVLTISTNEYYPHGVFEISSDNDILYTFELSSATKGLISGTQIYQYNINRGKNNSRSVASFYRDDASTSTVGYIDKTLDTGRIISGNQFVSDLSSADWLLDDERVYTLKVQNMGVDNCWISIRYKYHEHPPVHMTEITGNGEDEPEYDAGLIV